MVDTEDADPGTFKIKVLCKATSQLIGCENIVVVLVQQCHDVGNCLVTLLHPLHHRLDHLCKRGRKHPAGTCVHAYDAWVVHLVHC